jgi:hypothetical protein
MTLQWPLSLIRPATLPADDPQETERQRCHGDMEI